jgi:flagellar basal body-associated protein FliL
MAENTMPEANQTEQTNQANQPDQPQKKGKGWLWAILGCGGCLVIIIITVVIFVIVGAASLRWKSYSYPLGKFETSFPNSPKVESSTETVDGSPVSLTQYSADDGTTAYLVQYAALPDSTNVSDANKLLDSALQGEVNAKSGSKIVSSGFSTFAGYPAQDYTIMLSDGTYLKGKNILVNKTLYTIMAGSKEQNPKNYQKFIDSFKLQ